MNHSVLSSAARLALLAGSAWSQSAQAQSTEPFPAQFQLSSLATGDGSNGFVLNGINAYDFSGYSVSSAGDVNGDGIDDLIIGAPAADPNGNSGSGKSYVVFGGAGVGAGGSFNLSSLTGPNGFVLDGIDAGDNSGASVSAAGDVNGDGIDDLIIGADRGSPNGAGYAGESYVVFGAFDLGIGGVGTGGIFNLPLLSGSNGFVLNGIDAGDTSGFSVSSAGDVNGDGIDDLIIGARYADPNGNSSGGSYVVFGAADLGTGGVGTGGSFNLSALTGTNGFVLNGNDTYDYSGRSVSSAGDVNGDGIDDLIIGAYRADPNGNSSAGESYVVFGRANANVWASPVGGSWDTGSNWHGGLAPIGGVASVATAFGVTVTGPAGAVFLDNLTLSGTFTETTLELVSGSLMSLSQPFELDPSAALAGSGLFAANAGFTISGAVRPLDLTIAAASGLANSGEIDLSALGRPSGVARMSVFGPVSNQAGGEILMRRGEVEFRADDGVANRGTLSIAYAAADVLAPINNTASGLVSISGASSALITEDVTNAGSIVLTDDSGLVILGSIVGNGVSGPGGAGTAGSVYIEGGVIPGLLANPLGTSRFDGDLDLGFSAYTVIEIGGTIPGVSMDQIAAQRLGASGTLEIQLVNGYTPQPGDVYQVLDFTAATGSFSSVVLDPALTSAGADTSDLLVNGIIFIAAPCAPDLNGDGFVDQGDIQSFIALFLAQDLAVDFNSDGIIDQGDIQGFIAAFLEGC